MDLLNLMTNPSIMKLMGKLGMNAMQGKEIELKPLITDICQEMVVPLIRKGLEDEQKAHPDTKIYGFLNVAKPEYSAHTTILFRCFDKEEKQVGKSLWIEQIIYQIIDGKFVSQLLNLVRQVGSMSSKMKADEAVLNEIQANPKKWLEESIDWLGGQFERLGKAQGGTVIIKFFIIQKDKKNLLMCQCFAIDGENTNSFLVCKAGELFAKINDLIASLDIVEESIPQEIQAEAEPSGEDEGAKK